MIGLTGGLGSLGSAGLGSLGAGDDVVADASMAPPAPRTAVLQAKPGRTTASTAATKIRRSAAAAPGTATSSAANSSRLPLLLAGAAVLGLGAWWYVRGRR